MTWARNRRLLGTLRLDDFTKSPSLRKSWGTKVSAYAHANLRRCYAKGPEPMTEVEKILLDTIKATGPISFATYMQMCLSHPTTGYYMNPAHAVIGSKGDFITSPEISQVFGELLGIWHLSQFMTDGGSREIRFVELGPGRGTLMQHVLRAFSFFPENVRIKEIHLVETSPPMRSAQAARLGPIAEVNDFKLFWHDSLDAVPYDASKFTCVLAHEFFDALPFHLLQRTAQGWEEVLIASGSDPAAPTVLKPDGSSSTTSPPGSSPALLVTRFRQVLSPVPTPSSTLLGLSSKRFPKLPVGSRIEVSPAAFKIARQIGKLLQVEGSDGSRTAGTALIVDYGGDKVYGNSFRAFKNHKIVDVFHRPGECDLTTNVDFTYLQEAVADLVAHHGPITQAAFLERMGIRVRVAALQSRTDDEERKKQIVDAAKRLVDETGMGSQYKIMALTGKRGLTVNEKWPFVEDKVIV